MLVKVHAFVSNIQVVTTWMREVISQSAQRVRVWEQEAGCIIADIHHGIMDWLQSDILEKLAQSEYTDGDEDLEEALVWRTKVVSTGVF
jgi:hypothetical protein